MKVFLSRISGAGVLHSKGEEISSQLLDHQDYIQCPRAVIRIKKSDDDESEGKDIEKQVEKGNEGSIDVELNAEGEGDFSHEYVNTSLMNRSKFERASRMSVSTNRSIK